MHVGLWQELAQALDGDNRFLPMTDVVISPSLISGESTFAFVAINKDQIVHIGELSEALQRLRQDAQRVLSAEKRVVPDLVATHHP
jgi:predicted amidohydrolase YtcJ